MKVIDSSTRRCVDASPQSSATPVLASVYFTYGEQKCNAAADDSSEKSYSDLSKKHNRATLYLLMSEEFSEKLSENYLNNFRSFCLFVCLFIRLFEAFSNLS